MAIVYNAPIVQAEKSTLINRIKLTKNRNYMTKVGLLGIGLDSYWAQFDGLPDNLKLPRLSVLRALH